MRRTALSRSVLPAALLGLALSVALPLYAQEIDYATLSIRVEPSSLRLVAGQSRAIAIEVIDATGEPVDVPWRAGGARGAIDYDDDTGLLTATRAGDFELIVTAFLPPAVDAERPTLRIPITVAWPPISRIEIRSPQDRLYAGTRVTHSAVAYHADGSERLEAPIRWSSSDPSVAAVDRFGNVDARRPGRTQITAEVEGVRESVAYVVAPFPAADLSLEGGSDAARTGDVLRFDPVATGPDGAPIDDLPVDLTYTFIPDDSIEAPGAAAIVQHDGRFVAEVPGRYDVIAMAGPLRARRTVEVEGRQVVREVEIVGQGSVDHVHTSDLWVYEGVDGRDYALTGTWGGDGLAYVWDVTDPGNVIKTDSVRVDARTVNDVKVAPNGRWGALSREGASNRRNGVVILDLADPAHPAVAAEYAEGLTGGVHNMFATDDHLFALSGGDKYMILDMSDITAPRYVSEYDHPDSRIHDVWVHDGVAYSSEWGTGVVVVDVGNGRWGGTIEDPVFVTNVPYPVGRTHAAFPYYQEETGRFYLFLGDEILNRRGAAWQGFGGNAPYDPETGEGGVQSPSSGYIHIIDFTDPENPEDVARYEVPEFGTHNMWVEDDVLYVAYYEGGLRAVDVRGELMGNLATQGREMAVFKAFDPTGFMPNQPNAWGPQPHKGHVFVADFNSGLWSVRIVPPARPVS